MNFLTYEKYSKFGNPEQNFPGFQVPGKRRISREFTIQEIPESNSRLDTRSTDFKGRIHSDKACVLCCSLNNRAVNSDILQVYIEGKEL